MNLKVLLPTEILVDEEARKVVAEAANGSFCLQPLHIDFAAVLVPGLLMFEDADGEEVFLAIDEGALVKCGDEVLVSSRRAVRGPSFEELQETVEKEFRALDERERNARSASARLEAGLVRRFIELQHP